MCFQRSGVGCRVISRRNARAARTRSSNGAVKDRATELADVRPAAGMKLKSFTTSQVRVRLYGTAGVVTGIVEWAFDGGKTSVTRRRYTAVYAKGGPLGWQLVTLHMGRAE